MNRKYGTVLILFFSVLLITSSKAIAEAEGQAWVCGYAQPQGGYVNLQGTYSNLAGVEVIALERGEVIATTEDDGTFRFQYPVGEELTLLFKAGWWNFYYQPSQSETIVVQKTSLGDQEPSFCPHNMKDAGYPDSKYPNFITYQAIARYKISFISLARRIDWYGGSWGPSGLRKGCFQMIVTAAEKNKTLYDTRQGIDGAEIELVGKDEIKLEEGDKGLHFCYYGAGLCCSHTNPFCQFEKETTEDGGVFIANVPVSDSGRIKILARHSIQKFNTCTIRTNQLWWLKHAAKDMMFINLSPPALRVQPPKPKQE